ncbi:MAG TPA: MBOAT family protein [Brumimicrobium sp.]|nr:MBOAT family protein [Brumimicrobium sp.]
MLFNSFEFVLFLPLVYVLYWLLRTSNYSKQNLLLLLASYFFYAGWDWRFLFLLLFSTILDYVVGIEIEKSKTKKSLWLWFSIIINVGFLGFFKYYNFFVDSFTAMLNNFNIHVNTSSLNIILPIGISFYTFHGLSYVIDIYQGKIKAERNFIDYSLFVSFFPLLVAGPIERATHLLPQLKKKRVFNYNQSVDGLRQILWGLAKKVIIADGAAVFVNQIFDNYPDYNGSTLLLGVVLFAFQIYGDFSGYSDIAIGTAKLFGINLLKNFNYPYFSRDIAEFWRRWHISLTTWFRDYIYIPLGGSRGGLFQKIKNTFIIFLISGFWHGANWTFIFWGLLNALLFIPLLLRNKNRNHLGNVAQGRVFPNWREMVQMISTFLLTTLAWTFFRSPSIGDAFAYLTGIFNRSIFEEIMVEGTLVIQLLILLLILIEWKGRNDNYGIEKLGLTWNKYLRYGLYYLLIVALFWFAGKEQEFIYFQF